MSDLVVSAQIAIPASPGTAPLALAAALADAPDAIRRLPEGHILNGTVIGHDGKGRLLVRTDFGQLILQTPQKIPDGSKLILELRSAGARLHVLILQVATPEGALSQAPVSRNPSAQPTAPDTAVGPRPSLAAAPVAGTVQNPHHVASLSPDTDHISIGRSLRATIQTATTESTALPAGLNRLPAGTELVIRITAIGVPAQNLASPAPAAPASPSTVLQGSPPLAGAAASPTPAVPRPTDAPPPARFPRPPFATAPSGSSVPNPTHPPQAPQQGTPDLPARGPIETARPALVAPAQPLSEALAPRELAAVLTGHGRRGALAAQSANLGNPSSIQTTTPRAAPNAPALAVPGPVPATPQGDVHALVPQRFTALVTALAGNGAPVLQTPLGTVLLEPRAAIPIGSSLAFEVLRSHPLESSGTKTGRPANWPAVTALLDSLPTDPGLRSEMLDRLFPRPGIRLTSSLLLFLTALKGGSIEGWLGGYTALLDKLRKNGAQEPLRNALTGLTRVVDSGGADWRLFLIPFLHDGEASTLRFFLHEDGSQEGDRAKRRKPGVTRFILDVELTRLGGLQLDGLVKPRSFDLVLRSDSPLSSAARQHISGIFLDANKIAGLAGQISFQSTEKRQIFDDPLRVEPGHPYMTV